MPYLDQHSLKLFDDLQPFDDVIEVEFMPLGFDVRAVRGLFAGYERYRDGAWYLLVKDKATIRTADIVCIRKIEETAGRPQ